MKLSFWQRFKAGLFTKAQFITGVSLFVLISSAVIYAYDALNLTVFSAGTTISAAQVNANFAAINAAIGKLNKKFIVGLSTNLTVGATSDALAIFNTVVIDATGYSYAYDLVSNSSFTVQENGLYEVTLLGMNATSNTYYPVMYLMNSASQVLGSITNLYDTSTNAPGQISQKYYFNSGEVLYVKTFSFNSTSGGTYDLDSAKTKLIFEKID